MRGESFESQLINGYSHQILLNFLEDWQGIILQRDPDTQIPVTATLHDKDRLFQGTIAFLKAEPYLSAQGKIATVIDFYQENNYKMLSNQESEIVLKNLAATCWGSLTKSPDAY